jgi:hypothetical protein
VPLAQFCVADANVQVRLGIVETLVDGILEAPDGIRVLSLSVKGDTAFVKLAALFVLWAFHRGHTVIRYVDERHSWKAGEKRHQVILFLAH